MEWIFFSGRFLHTTRSINWHVHLCFQCFRETFQHGYIVVHWWTRWCCIPGLHKQRSLDIYFLFQMVPSCHDSSRFTLSWIILKRQVAGIKFTANNCKKNRINHTGWGSTYWPSSGGMFTTDFIITYLCWWNVAKWAEGPGVRPYWRFLYSWRGSLRLISQGHAPCLPRRRSGLLWYSLL